MHVQAGLAKTPSHSRPYTFQEVTPASRTAITQLPQADSTSSKTLVGKPQEAGGQAGLGSETLGCKWSSFFSPVGINAVCT